MKLNYYKSKIALNSGYINNILKMLWYIHSRSNLRWHIHNKITNNTSIVQYLKKGMIS